MSGNLFSDLYVVKEKMFDKMPAEQEISTLRKEVDSCISNNCVPDKLHYLMFKMTNRCNSDCEYCPHAISRIKSEIKNDISKEKEFFRSCLLHRQLFFCIIKTLYKNKIFKEGMMFYE